jgi:acyl carrier protein
MLTKEDVQNIIRDSIVAINEEKQGGEQIPVAEDTVLMGSGTVLDSLDFILLVTNIEERLYASIKQQIQLVHDMGAFDNNNPFRTADSLSDHIISVIGTE